MIGPERQERVYRKLVEIQDNKAKHSPAMRQRAKGAFDAIYSASQFKTREDGLKHIRKIAISMDCDFKTKDANWGWACYVTGYVRGVKFYRRIWGL